METLMVCGYFPSGILTESNAVAAAIVYQKDPREIYLTTGRINSFNSRVAHVLKDKLLELGVRNQHIKVKAKAKNTIQEVQIYNSMLPSADQNRNFLANDVQHPRLLEILRRENIHPVGEVLSTRDILEDDHQYALLDTLMNSKQQAWYAGQEQLTMEFIKRYTIAYDLLKIAGNLPFKGDFQYLSYLLYCVLGIAV